MKEYRNLEDLLDDPSFQLYARGIACQESEMWKELLEQEPALRPLARQATAMIRGLSLRTETLSEAQIEQAYASTMDRIREDDNASPARGYIYAVAASISLAILAASLWWWIPYFHLVTEKTAYGETREILLADGTSVTMNANSELSYDPRYMLGQERKVFLKGEAFFDVVSMKSNGLASSFLVISEEGGVVEVLGTSFNVTSRRNKTRVVLESGLVNFSGGNAQTSLLPGEMAEYNELSRKIYKKKVPLNKYSAWKEKRLYFDDTPLAELAGILEDNYGFTVVFRQEHLKAKRISGEISALHVDNILKAVERIFSIQISRQQDTLFIDSYEP